MLNINSFTKIRFFVLLISIISALSLTQFAQAQEEEQLEAVLPPVSLTILGEPLITEFTEEIMSFRFEVINEGPETVDFTYGAEISTLATEDEDTRLIDVGGGTNETSLNSDETEIFTFTYQVPSWLEGEHDIFVVLTADNGTSPERKIVDSAVFLGASPDIEILNDSCVFKEESGNIIPLSEDFTTHEDGELKITCLVINTTDTEQTVTPRIEAYAPTLNGKEVGSDKEDSVTLPTGEAKEFIFTLPAPDTNGLYGVRLSLDTDLTSNTVVAANLENILDEVPEDNVVAPHSATEEESNTALYVIATLLALTVLLAILVYRRKKTEELPDPEMGDSNPEN